MPRTDHESRKHAPLPPSASSRWLACAPSQGYIKALIAKGTIKKRVSGEAAKRGTRIHELAERALRAELTGKIPHYPRAEPSEILEAMAYVSHCMKLWRDTKLIDKNAVWGIEERSEVTDDCWGSCDFWIYSKGWLTIVDLKTGRESIDPKGNTQLIIYAIGIVAKLMKKLGSSSVRWVRIALWQPNADPDDPARDHTYSIDEFMKLADEIRDGIASAASWLKEKTPKKFEHALVAGAHCEYCDALGVCPAARSRALEISSSNFVPVPVDKVVLPSVTTLEPDQVGEICRRAPMFIAWLDAVRERGLELAQKGREIPGMKVVMKITRRAWDKDYTPGQIAKGLGMNVKEISEVRMLSPSKVEQKLKGEKKKRVGKYTFRPPGDPTIVLESDRRQAIPSTKISFTPVSRGEEDDD